MTPKWAFLMAVPWTVYISSYPIHDGRSGYQIGITYEGKEPFFLQCAAPSKEFKTFCKREMFEDLAEALNEAHERRMMSESEHEFLRRAREDVLKMRGK